MATTSIRGFHQDAEGDWVAELACGHGQHVRHRPPWQVRPWVTSEAGRSERLGTAIECPLCQMPSLPPDVHAYRRTATFTEATTPAGLLRDHSTKPGTWARIVVEEGTLGYRLECPSTAFVLTPTNEGVIPPVVPHQVQLLGPVRFYIEFLKPDGA
jgi:tellurite methyltransferase